MDARGLIASLLLVAACATTPGAGEPDRCRRAGHSEIQPDGTLVITLYQRFQDQIRVYPPSHPQYANWLRWAGRPEPGRQQPIPRYSGMVSMAENGVITVIEGGQVEPMLVEPSEHIIPPGDFRYESARNRVGGLEPGEFKGIAAPPPPGCEGA